MKKAILIFVFLFFTAMFGGSANAQEIQDEPSAQAVKKYDQNIQIKKKPRPRVGRLCSQSQGTTMVLATFDKSSKVTDVEVMTSSGCKGFDENSVKAAKKIKFTPAMKNGEAVTVQKRIVYNFTLYQRGF